MERILLVGGGLVGSVLAMVLTRRGHRVTVIERHPDPRAADNGSRRSINLTLCERGLAPLERLGIRRRIQGLGIPAAGRIVHGSNGENSPQPYGNRGEKLYSVQRQALHASLTILAEEDFGVRFEFDTECLAVDLERPAATFRNRTTQETAVREADRIFGTDGAYSPVRLQMQRTLRRFDVSQQHLDQAYKELSAPPAEDGDWPLDSGALHIWPRGHYMLIGFANPDRSFTLALHLPYVGEPSLASIRDGADLQALFERSFPDALPLLPDLVTEYFERPAAAMVTVRCHPWICGDKVALVGDAAHAIVPSYGQGANSGFEDCGVLDECLAAAGGDWKAALAAYQEERKPNADAIADLALEHFHELRDRVGDPAFQLRKKIERRLNERAPERFTPLYNLVSFTSIPYREALELDRRQSRLVEQLLAIEEIESLVDSRRFEDLLDEVLRDEPHFAQSP